MTMLRMDRSSGCFQADGHGNTGMPRAPRSWSTASVRLEEELSMPSVSRTMPAGAVMPDLATAASEAAIEVAGSPATRILRSAALTEPASLSTCGERPKL
jgi:hypothetical protein